MSQCPIFNYLTEMIMNDCQKKLFPKSVLPVPIKKNNNTIQACHLLFTSVSE